MTTRDISGKQRMTVSPTASDPIYANNFKIIAMYTQYLCDENNPPDSLMNFDEFCDQCGINRYSEQYNSEKVFWETNAFRRLDAIRDLVVEAAANGEDRQQALIKESSAYYSSNPQSLQPHEVKGVNLSYGSQKGKKRTDYSQITVDRGRNRIDQLSGEETFQLMFFNALEYNERYVFELGSNGLPKSVKGLPPKTNHTRKNEQEETTQAQTTEAPTTEQEASKPTNTNTSEKASNVAWSSKTAIPDVFKNNTKICAMYIQYLTNPNISDEEKAEMDFDLFCRSLGTEGLDMEEAHAGRVFRETNTAATLNTIRDQLLATSAQTSRSDAVISVLSQMQIRDINGNILLPEQIKKIAISYGRSSDHANDSESFATISVDGIIVANEDAGKIHAALGMLYLLDGKGFEEDENGLPKISTFGTPYKTDKNIDVLNREHEETQNFILEEEIDIDETTDDETTDDETTDDETTVDEITEDEITEDEITEDDSSDDDSSGGDTTSSDDEENDLNNENSNYDILVDIKAYAYWLEAFEGEFEGKVSDISEIPAGSLNTDIGVLLSNATMKAYIEEYGSLDNYEDYMRHFELTVVDGIQNIGFTDEQGVEIFYIANDTISGGNRVEEIQRKIIEINGTYPTLDTLVEYYGTDDFDEIRQLSTPGEMFLLANEYKERYLTRENDEDNTISEVSTPEDNETTEAKENTEDETPTDGAANEDETTGDTTPPVEHKLDENDENNLTGEFDVLLDFKAYAYWLDACQREFNGEVADISEIPYAGANTDTGVLLKNAIRKAYVETYGSEEGLNDYIDHFNLTTIDTIQNIDLTGEEGMDIFYLGQDYVYNNGNNVEEIRQRITEINGTYPTLDNLVEYYGTDDFDEIRQLSTPGEIFLLANEYKERYLTRENDETNENSEDITPPTLEDETVEEGISGKPFIPTPPPEVVILDLEDEVVDEDDDTEEDTTTEEAEVDETVEETVDDIDNDEISYDESEIPPAPPTPDNSYYDPEYNPNDKIDPSTFEDNRPDKLFSAQFNQIFRAYIEFQNKHHAEICESRQNEERVKKSFFRRLFNRHPRSENDLTFDQFIDKFYGEEYASYKYLGQEFGLSHSLDVITGAWAKSGRFPMPLYQELANASTQQGSTIDGFRARLIREYNFSREDVNQLGLAELEALRNLTETNIGQLEYTGVPDPRTGLPIPNSTNHPLKEIVDENGQRHVVPKEPTENGYNPRAAMAWEYTKAHVQEGLSFYAVLEADRLGQLDVEAELAAEAQYFAEEQERRAYFEQLSEDEQARIIAEQERMEAEQALLNDDQYAYEQEQARIAAEQDEARRIAAEEARIAAEQAAEQEITDGNNGDPNNNEEDEANEF